MKQVLGFLSRYKKILLSALIVIVLIILLASSVYIITIDDGEYKEDDWSSTPYAASTYTQGAKISGNGIETTQTAQELWDKMNQNGSNVGKYLDTPEELEKLMKAEIVTQYPKIGAEEGKLDGIIEFKRAIADGSSINGLTYVDEETFNSYIEKYNTDGNDIASKYFTIDSAGNVLMSQWTKVTTVTTVSQNDSSSSNTEVSYSMTTTSINYKSVIQKYSMPFDYLWAFLVMGDDKNLVLELADYVIEDSQIEITGFENKTSATDVQEESEEVEVQVPVEVKDPETGETKTEMQTETQTKTTKIETTVESNNVTADLTIADTWLIDYSKDYKYENDNWVAGEVKSDPKVDRDSEKKKKGRNFVTIFNRYYNARKNIIGSASWLFEILETNTSTANMVDMTKYLLYKATGTNYGVEDFDFSEYEPGSLTNVTFGSGGASYESLNLTDEDLKILYKITSAERGGGTQQQQEYVVSVILNRVLSSNFPNTVKGVVFAPMQFQPTRNGAYEKAQPTATTITAVNNVVETGDKAKCAVYFMTPGAALGQQSWLSNCEYLFNDEDESLKDTNTGGSHNFYTTQQVKNELQQYMTAGNGSIVESAIAIHKYVRENGYRYAQSGIKVPNTSGRTIDCSSYVTWVLVNCATQGFGEGMYQWTSGTFAGNPKGWQEISVQDAQPGDILVYSGHVEIVAAPTKVEDQKFMVYNCGGNSSIQAIGTVSLPETSVSGHSKSKIIKILRVP